MNDSELESRLKSIPVPERSTDYWNDFPAGVRRQLRNQHRGFTPGNPWRPRFTWAGGLAAALALAFIGIEFHPLKTTSLAITNHERQFHVQLAQLDAGLHVLMFNPHGMGYLLAEAN